MWENETNSVICNLLQVDPEKALLPAYEIIKEGSGYDITLPKPSKNNKIIMNENTLNDMSISQLKLLHSKTQGCITTVKKRKAKIIEEILQHHSIALKQKKTKIVKQPSVNSLSDTLQKKTTKEFTLVDFYTNQYNLVDRMNYYYYRVVNYSAHRTWEKLFFFFCDMGLSYHLLWIVE